MSAQRWYFFCVKYRDSPFTKNVEENSRIWRPETNVLSAAFLFYTILNYALSSICDVGLKYVVMLFLNLTWAEALLW